MDTKQLFIKMALQAWNSQITRLSQSLLAMNEDQFLTEIAPGKNRVLYIAGHLLVIHDAMNAIFGLGTRAHTDLDEAFLKNPDRSGFEMPSGETLKQYWTAVHKDLDTKFQEMPPENWFKRHEAMTDEDFAKDSARNKLSVLLNRTNHAAYHLGQLRLVR